MCIRDSYYRVQTGVFRKRENADRMLYMLQEKGYPAYILQDGEFYKVQAGAFSQLDNAIRMEQKLREDEMCIRDSSNGSLIYF